MTKVKLLHPVSHDGVTYTAGSTFEGDDATVAHLVNVGAARDPKAPVEDENASVSDAKDKAEAIIAKAEKALADAKAEAEKTAQAAVDAAGKLTATAEADAEKVRSATQKEADRIIADAKAEAEKIKKAAQSK